MATPKKKIATKKKAAPRKSATPASAKKARAATIEKQRDSGIPNVKTAKYYSPTRLAAINKADREWRNSKEGKAYAKRKAAEAKKAKK